MQKLTVNLVVESIDACLPFWVGRLGFDKTIEVEADDGLSFVILERNGLELIMQTLESLAEDLPALSATTYKSFIYIDVEDLGALRSALVDHPKVVPERETFDGNKELIVRDPAGNVVILSQKIK